VKFANKTWGLQNDHAEAKAKPIAYLAGLEADIQVAEARCSVDLGVLMKRDKRGDWQMFEHPARQGIAAVQAWGLGVLNLQTAIRTKSQTTFHRTYNKAIKETTLAVALWRYSVAGINIARARAGLGLFRPQP
jgi:hypothetical protein